MRPVRMGEDGAQKAPAPLRIVEGDLPIEAPIAHVLVAKHADHLPLYRQAQIYARQGIPVDRSTPADRVGRAAWWLRRCAITFSGNSGARSACSPMGLPRRFSNPGRDRTVPCGGGRLAERVKERS